MRVGKALVLPLGMWPECFAHTWGDAGAVLGGLQAGRVGRGAGAQGEEKLRPGRGRGAQQKSRGRTSKERIKDGIRAGLPMSLEPVSPHSNPQRSST